MANLGTFDANAVNPDEFAPLPAGDYVAAITKSELKKTKKGDGEYLNLSYQVLDGPCKGRLLWEMLNLKNAEPKAVAIAQAKLSAICRAVGVMVPKDSAALHDIPLTIKVRLRPNKETGDLQNEIKGHEKRGAQATPPAGNTGGGHSQAAPWKR